MLRRTIVAAILLPIAIAAIYYGGLIYALFILLFLAGGAWEYIDLLKKVDLQPSRLVAVGGVIVLTVLRTFFQFDYLIAALTGGIFLGAFYHILQFERVDTRPAHDFGATLSVLFYIGFLGPYLISLRSLPDGMWWTFMVLPIVWIADSFAYLIGSRFGKHKLAPKTSPHKTWEGYFAGIISGVPGSIGLLALYNQVFDAGFGITTLEAGLLGLIISALIPLGDLTESLIKRQAGEKDSGAIFPGHGGFFDRLDSFFWAAPIGYYLIFYLFQ
jgi:phosphatidate cytidylyltransferase